MKYTSGKTPFIFCLLMALCVNVSAQDPNFHLYLCFGQSNMCGAGAIEAKDETVDSRFQMMEPIGCTNSNRSFGEWYPATPPLWGCNGGLGPADYFGRTMVENLPSDIRVGVIVVAVPGCDIALFYKTGYQGFDTYNNVPAEYGGSAYAWLLELAKQAQNDGVIKGILLHQGETNNGQTDWPEKVKKVYDDFIEDLELEASETPLLVGELLYQNQGGTCGGHNSVIAKVPDVIPNSYVISAEGLAGKDQFHFTTESNREIGRRYAERMLELVEPVMYRYENLPQLNDRRMMSIGKTGISATGALRISIPGSFRYRLFNSYGSLMEYGNGTDVLMTGGGCAKGIYFLSVKHGRGSFTEKFVKK
jgi:hypothetical protein